MKRAPIRLLESRELSALEHTLLEAGRSVPPVHYDVAAGATRLRAALAVAGDPSGTVAGQPVAPLEAATLTGAPTALAGATALVKLVCVLVSVVGAAAVYQALSSGSAPRAAITASPSSQASQPAPSPPAPTVPASLGVAPQPIEPAASEVPRIVLGRAERERARAGHAKTHTVARAQRVPGAVRDRDQLAPPPLAAPSAIDSREPEPKPVSPAAEVTGGAGPVAELRDVARARALVSHDPATALAVLERLAQTHPHGYFIEEREALTILALTQAGQHDLAKPRATKFLREHPQSPLADRVRAAVSR
jgi:hypothetical protein